MARTDPATREQRAGDFYREKINAARETRRAGAEAYVQATLAEGRIANTVKHAPGTEQGATGASVENIRQLHEDARLDITNYRPTTVEDIAREIGPAFAGADDRVKALRQAQVNLNNLIDATDNSRYLIQREHEQCQRQMSGLRTVLDRYGPLRDRQLFDLEERMGRLSAEHEALIMRAPALGHDVSAAEHTRAAEFDKVRKPAERELADRQQRAAAARAELAAQRARELARERAQWEAERQRERQQEREGHVHRHSRGLSLGR
jgi:chromosome segregation ATPase